MLLGIKIFHNAETDAEGHHTGMVDGFRDGDRVRLAHETVLDVEDDASADEIADRVYALGNDHPYDGDHSAAVSYYTNGDKPNRSISKGDVIAVGEVPLAVEGIGFRWVNAFRVVESEDEA